nr:MAG TPA: hypothetical protein [Caudoviricetes sp.]
MGACITASATRCSCVLVISVLHLLGAQSGIEPLALVTPTSTSAFPCAPVHFSWLAYRGTRTRGFCTSCVFDHIIHNAIAFCVCVNSSFVVKQDTCFHIGGLQHRYSDAICLPSHACRVVGYESKCMLSSNNAPFILKRNLFALRDKELELDFFRRGHLFSVDEFAFLVTCFGSCTGLRRRFEGLVLRCGDAIPCYSGLRLAAFRDFCLEASESPAEFCHSSVFLCG